MSLSDTGVRGTCLSQELFFARPVHLIRCAVRYLLRSCVSWWVGCWKRRSDGQYRRRVEGTRERGTGGSNFRSTTHTPTPGGDSPHTQLTGDYQRHESGMPVYLAFKVVQNMWGRSVDERISEHRIWSAVPAKAGRSRADLGPARRLYRRRWPSFWEQESGVLPAPAARGNMTCAQQVPSRQGTCRVNSRSARGGAWGRRCRIHVHRQESRSRARRARG